MTDTDTERNTNTNTNAVLAPVCATTPPRNSSMINQNNTPIASIKRPRNYKSSSSSISSGSGSGSMSMTPTRTPPLSSTSAVQQTTPTMNRRSNSNSNSNSNTHTHLSPMHPASAFHRNPHDGIVNVNIERETKVTVQTVDKMVHVHVHGHSNDEDTLQDCGASVTTESAADTASWVGRKVDALFSPVLSFLQSQHDDKQVEIDGSGCPVTIHTESMSTSTDKSVNGDVVMLPSNSYTNTNSNSKLVVEDDDLIHDYEHNIDSDDDDDDDDDDADNSHASSMQALQELSEEDQDDFNPWQFIQLLPPYSTVQHLTPPVSLPPKDPSAPNLTLVLDLDETLVHCTVEACQGADFEFPVVFHGVSYQVHVRQRPYLAEFLQKIAGKYEVVIFTASQKVYADTLLNQLDPDGTIFHHRLFRESCLAVEGNFLKDLNVLGRDLSKTVLVDNSPHAFGYQVDNGIPIESWFDDKDDRELLKLERFLRQLRKAEQQGVKGGTAGVTGAVSSFDVRDAVRTKFQSQQRVDAAPALDMM